MEWNELPKSRRIALTRVANDMVSLSEKYRGHITEYFTMMETVMELIVSDYFTSNNKVKANYLRCALLAQEGFNFHNKRRLVIFVMANGFPEFEKKHSGLDGKIQDINAFRNIISHRKLLMSVETLTKFDNNTIFLLGLSTKNNKPEPKPIKLNRQKIDSETNLIKAVTATLQELHNLVKKNPEPSKG